MQDSKLRSAHSRSRIISQDRFAPGAALQIQNATRAQVSKINQYYASVGRTNSTDHIKAVQQAQNNGIAQYQQFLNSELSASLQASGQAGSYFAQAAQIQMQADTAFNAALTSAMAGIGKIAATGLSGGTGQSFTLTPTAA